MISSLLRRYLARQVVFAVRTPPRYGLRPPPDYVPQGASRLTRIAFDPAYVPHFLRSEVQP